MMADRSNGNFAGLDPTVYHREGAHEEGSAGTTAHGPPPPLGAGSATFGETKLAHLSKAAEPPGVAVQSTPRKTFGGKTQAMWGVERRRIIADLRSRWLDAMEHAGSGAFAVHADGFVEQLNRWMPEFRDVPREQVLSGVLQLLRDGLTGDNFTRLEEHDLHSVILSVLELHAVAKEETITLAAFDKAHSLLLEAGLLG